jgi:hypothetical protein
LLGEFRGCKVPRNTNILLNAAERRAVVAGAGGLPPVLLPHHPLHRLAQHAHGRASAPLKLERPQVTLLGGHCEGHVHRFARRYHLPSLARYHLRLALLHDPGVFRPVCFRARIRRLGVPRGPPPSALTLAFAWARGCTLTDLCTRTAVTRAGRFWGRGPRRLVLGLIPSPTRAVWPLGRRPRRRLSEGLLQGPPPPTLPLLSHR